MKSMLLASLLTVTNSATSAPRLAVSNTGNTSFSGHSIPIMPTLEGITEFELIDAVRNYVSVDIAAEIQAAVDPNSGTIRIVELYGASVPGIADAGTIAIDTKTLPPWYLAVVLAHEWQHAKSAQAAAPNDPDARDPNTSTASAGPCAKCNHAMMRVTDLNWIGGIICDEEQFCDPLPDGCKAWDDNYDALGDMLSMCHFDGCGGSAGGCCGFPYVPLPSALVERPECCQ